MTQRRHDRHVVTPRLFVAINGSSAGGILHDVSDGGVSLDVVGEAPAGARVLLDFDMSEIGEHFEGFGRIVWNNESKNRVGFQFVDLPDASRNKVRNWLSVKSASRDTLQNMVVQDWSEPTSVEIPEWLKWRIGTSTTSVGPEPLEKEPAVAVAAGRTPWRTELERILPSKITTEPPANEKHAETFTDSKDLVSDEGPTGPTVGKRIPTEATIPEWITSTWNDAHRRILVVAIICLVIIFLGLAVRVLKTHRTYHTARSFFANLWSPSVPAHVTSPKTSTSTPPPNKSPQTTDRITDLSTGNRPPANQFEVMDAQNGRRYLPRTGTNVVIQASKSRPSPPANATSAETNVAKAGRVSQRSSGELPVVATIPEYPTFALQTNVQGRVVLNAVISTDGALHNVHLVSPSSMLDSTVLDAVKKWRYQPHYENGKPIEVETQITVDFSITTE